MSGLLTRLGLALLWLLHCLPLAAQAAIGNLFGSLLYRVIGRRRKVALTNLRLCFPELTEAERIALAKAHFRVLTRSLLERAMLWWASPKRLQRMIRVEGEEHLLRLEADGRPVLVLGPHFVAIEAGGLFLSIKRSMAVIYSRQSNAIIDRVLFKGRSRFHSPAVLARQDPIRTVIKVLRSGRPFHYSPDMDYGRRDAVFVPFFGVPTATVTSLSRLARISGAAVLPCTTQILPGGRGYIVRIEPPWENYPTDDVEADTRRMNAWLEDRIRQMPEQYYWVHKRFKTRPDGAPDLY